MQQGPANQQLVPFHGGDFRSLDQTSDALTEPYMVLGYDSLAQRDYDAQVERLHQTRGEKDTFSPLGSAVGGPDASGSWSQQYKQATDPVYQAQPDTWQKVVGQPQDTERDPSVDMAMAFQYGAYEQAAGYVGESSELGQRGGIDYGPVMEDEEML
jgi:hypothetical protein